jgi:hypothetical protein
MQERKRRFDIGALARAQFRSTDRRGAEAGLVDEPLPAQVAELLRLFQAAPRKPLLVSEAALLLGRTTEACGDAVLALVKAGSLDLLQRAEGGNHLVALTALGRAQVEAL